LKNALRSCRSLPTSSPWKEWKEPTDFKPGYFSCYYSCCNCVCHERRQELSKLVRKTIPNFQRPDPEEDIIVEPRSGRVYAIVQEAEEALRLNKIDIHTLVENGELCHCVCWSLLQISYYQKYIIF
jgi:hypothetical protein